MMHIHFNTDIEIFLEQDNGSLEELLVIHLDNIKVEFDMLVRDMWLHVIFKDITLGEARVHSRLNVQFE